MSDSPEVPGFKVSISGLPPRERVTKKIVVYICPTADCPNYYGAPDFVPGQGVNEMQYHRSQNDGTRVASHSRTECPFCREKGMRVQRVPYYVTEVISLEQVDKAVKVHVEVKGVAA